MNVIVVDDERIILAVETAEVNRALPQANVAAFLSAEEALEYARTQKIDIAFLDINLEEASGLEVAKALQSYNPRVNVIFCTGYSEYALEAFDLYSSGYLLKPITQDKLMHALERLRYPVEEEAPKVTAECFGNFRLLVNGEPVKFKYGKTMELFAYLVDRKGSLLSTNEIMAVLFDSDDKASYIRNLRADLIATCEALGIENVLIHERNRIGIRIDRLDCDYYRYLNGARELFHGEYMSQYSFAESTLAMLLNA